MPPASRSSYDRVYYIGEQDFYVPRDAKGKFKTYNTHVDAFADTMDVMRKLIPTHVVFNGASRSPDRQACHARQGRRDRADHALPGRSRLASTSGRRSRRLCLGDRQILKSPGDRSRDLVHPRRLRRCSALQVPPARHRTPT